MVSTVRILAVSLVTSLAPIVAFAETPMVSATPAPAAAAPAPAAAAPAPAAAAPAPAAKAELTAEGTVKKVVAKKKEIYVTPNDGGKKLEFYFPDNAQFLKNGQPVGFDALKEGQKVRVTYTKKGKRLNPTKAEILE